MNRRQAFGRHHVVAGNGQLAVAAKRTLFLQSGERRAMPESQSAARLGHPA